MLRRKNLVLKILILLGLIAILLSSYVQYGIPYRAEQESEKRDAQRIADLDALNIQIAEIRAASSTAPLGNPNTVYISLPSATSTCADLELPSLPEGWGYHCATGYALQNSDGTGWLPINFDSSEHSNILENVGMLPVDPINNPETLNYYAFVATSTFATTTETTKTEFVFTSVLDSKKYLTEKAQSDSGTDPERYEIGTDPILWALASGVFLYLPLSETQGYIAKDISGNSLDGQIINLIEWVDNKDKHGLKFNGINSYIDIPVGTLFEGTGISFGIQLGEQRDEVILSSLKFESEQDGHNGYIIHTQADGTVALDLFVKSYTPTFSLVSPPLNDGKWHDIRIQLLSDDSRMYVDHELESRNSALFDFGSPPANESTNIGRYNYLPHIRNYFSGVLNHVRIFRF